MPDHDVEVFAADRSGWVDGFPSVDKLVAALEPQDVEDSEYRCWRRDGSRIQLTVRDGRILASDSEETGSAKDLFEALIAYAQLRKVDLSQPVAAHKADPSMLLRFIEEHAREQSWWRRLLRAFSR